MTRRSLAAVTMAVSMASGAWLAAQGRQGGPPPRTTKAPPMYVVGGGERHGPSAFPRVDYPQMRPRVAGQIDFQHFHTYEETVGLLRGWAEKYSGILDLYSVGKSLEGREIWQVTIANKKGLPHTDRPAMFIEGGRHAGEISGIEATLYFINHVLTNYGTDPEITALVDTKTLYAKPFNNPDGASLYHLTAQTLRSSVRPVDNDNDGLLDEDPGEDLDGDGFIRQMRRYVGPGKGSLIKDKRDPQGRLMQNVGQGKGDYEVYPEGIDNDKDGRYNEDGIGGLDLHRNYPENWRPMREETGRGYTQGGAGAHPLSEPETMAVFMWLMTHPNVGIVQSLDTSVPMILRGPSVAKSEEAMLPRDLALIQKYDKVGLEITGYPWAGDTFFNYSTRNANPEFGEPQGTPLFGHGPDFGYSYYGAVWYGNEIWNGGRFTDYDKDGRIDAYEVLRWNDENRAGKGDFQMWTKIQHPELGEVEVGGWNPKFYSQNPPPDMLETWARNEAMFNLYLAKQLPQVRIVSASAKPAGKAGLYTIEMTVTNEGKMPTALDIAHRVKIVRPDTAVLTLGKGQEFAEPAKGQPRQRPAIEIGVLQAGETKTVSWQVQGAGQVRLAISSTRGGVDSRTLDVK